MTKFFKVALLVLATCIGGAAQARDEAMWEPHRVALSEQRALNAEDLRKVFIRAGARRNWSVVADNAGEIHLKQNRQGKHEAIVAIKYDATGYQLSYLSSYNLNAKPEERRIHPTYNMWLRNLSGGIESELTLTALK